MTNSGTSAAAVFDISIPRGATGAAAVQMRLWLSALQLNVPALQRQALFGSTLLKIGLRVTTAVQLNLSPANVDELGSTV